VKQSNAWIDPVEFATLLVRIESNGCESITGPGGVG